MKENINQELKEFLEDNSYSNSLPTSQPEEIKKDLVKAPKKVIVLWVSLFIIGYLVSLGICAQYGFGFFSFSHEFTRALEQLPPLVCASLCGFIFSATPIALISLFLSKFKTRYILFHYKALFLLLPFLATLILWVQKLLSTGTLEHATHNINILWHLFWILTAWGLPLLWERMKIRRAIIGRNFP